MIGSSNLHTGHVVVEQDIEKWATSSILILAANGSLNFYEIPETVESYLEVGLNGALTFTDNANIAVPTYDIPAIIIEENGSMIDETAGVTDGDVQIQQVLPNSNKLIFPNYSFITKASYSYHSYC